MGYVVSETERRGMLRVTCPARAVAESAKVSTMTASRTLASLAEKGLLVRYSRGRSGKEGNRKAAIYGLTDPEALPHNGNSLNPTSEGSTASATAASSPTPEPGFGT